MKHYRVFKKKVDSIYHTFLKHLLQLRYIVVCTMNAQYISGTYVIFKYNADMRKYCGRLEKFPSVVYNKLF